MAGEAAETGWLWVGSMKYGSMRLVYIPPKPGGNIHKLLIIQSLVEPFVLAVTS
jgi:hypothetical protein